MNISILNAMNVGKSVTLKFVAVDPKELAKAVRYVFIFVSGIKITVFSL